MMAQAPVGHLRPKAYICSHHARASHLPQSRRQPEEWRVEEIDSDGDGGCDVVIFSGRHADAGAPLL